MISFKQHFNEMVIPDFVKRLESLVNFNIKHGTIAGRDTVLVAPQHMGVDWTKDNVIFRSSIWTYPEGSAVSLSYKKFVNWGEKPDLFPPPQSLKDTVMLDKLDGSLLCISKFQGELIVRTRGTFDASKLENGHEIEVLKQKYPLVFNNDLLNSEQHSIICEWLSPTNVIVIKYGNEPELVLTGIIKHKDYSYMNQSELDLLGKKWNVKRPEYYKFDSIESMIQGVKGLKDKEGLCLYYNNYQDILKVKSIEYLTKHAFKENITPENMIDIYLEWNMPQYTDFINRIEATFDHECMIMSKEIVSRVCDAKKEVDRIIEHMKGFVEPLKNVSRKDAAQRIISSYGQTNRAGYAFSLLDNKPIKKEDYKKLLMQMLK